MRSILKNTLFINYLLLTKPQPFFQSYDKISFFLQFYVEQNFEVNPICYRKEGTIPIKLRDNGLLRNYVLKSMNQPLFPISLVKTFFVVKYQWDQFPNTRTLSKKSVVIPEMIN